MCRSIILGLVVSMLIAAGCGHRDYRKAARTAAKSDVAYDADELSEEADEDSASGMEMPGGMGGGMGMMSGMATPAVAKRAQGVTDATAAEPTTTDRKIIYEATLRLVVKEFPTAEAEIYRIAKTHEGFVADSDVDSIQGRTRAGKWIVRVPVKNYDAFLEAIVALGVAEKRSQNAQDVSERYIDLESRIANKKKLEERIVQLLTEQSGDIKDVIHVETELGRVREEIERMEGQLRFLANRVTLTTVTIHAREERDYQPPTAPSFGDRIKTAWANSLGELASFAANLAVAVVYFLPWLVLIVVLLALLAIAIKIVWRLLRRMMRRA